MPDRMTDAGKPAGDYCRPFNAGLASTPQAIGKRLGRLIDALGREVTSHVASGRLVDEIWRFRAHMIEQLQAEGWRTRAGDTRFVVLPPVKEGKSE
jgi:hypothetical protein